ncbi:MAG: MOP family flippase [Roseibaca calidilacus]|uniref:Efflux protein, MATE family n=1 Tax=Roseibaca calidilacus TaxID=1666912 RepID=A0A0P7YXD1_9RHOB|nr:MATE family efflux transporter [Roseibaca calidilacus]KPP95587.1 MAG: MOP family flippase [Roseibaca calidilacus]CUX82045.1 putative efflux protein, MATE family [Roseibaca calidilacus]
MSTPRTRNLRQGSIPGHFRALAVPAAIGLVFSTLYNVVDLWYAGLLGTDAQAGLAITFQVFMLLIAFGVGLSSAMSALVGNALGAEDSHGARQIATQGLVFGTLTALALAVAGIWGSPALLALVSEPGAYRDAANAYMNVILLATAPFLLAFGGNGILSAQGDTNSMKRAQIAAFFANLALNPLFVFGLPGLLPGLGFNGIALATLVSQTGVMGYILWQVMRSEVMDGARAWRPDLARAREIAAQALPATFAMMILLVAGFFVQMFLKGFGPSALAAYGVGLRIEQLILLPGFGLTGALLPIVAQNFGAGQYDRVREAWWFCLKVGTAIMLSGSGLLWFAAAPLVALFSTDPQVIRLGTDYLHVDGFILPVYLALFAVNAMLQAFKRPMATVWIGIWRQGIAVGLFCWLYVTVFDWGTWGVWFGIATAVISGLALSLWVLDRIARDTIGGLLARPQAHPAV